jgi:hypothetical protein
MIDPWLRRRVKWNIVHSCLTKRRTRKWNITSNETPRPRVWRHPKEDFAHPRVPHIPCMGCAASPVRLPSCYHQPTFSPMFPSPPLPILGILKDVLPHPSASVVRWIVHSEVIQLVMQILPPFSRQMESKEEPHRSPSGHGWQSTPYATTPWGLCRQRRQMRPRKREGTVTLKPSPPLLLLLRMRANNICQCSFTLQSSEAE